MDKVSDVVATRLVSAEPDSVVLTPVSYVTILHSKMGRHITCCNIGSKSCFIPRLIEADRLREIPEKYVPNNRAQNKFLRIWKTLTNSAAHDKEGLVRVWRNGRRMALKMLGPRAWGFKSPHPHQRSSLTS